MLWKKYEFYFIKKKNPENYCSNINIQFISMYLQLFIALIF